MTYRSLLLSYFNIDTTYIIPRCTAVNCYCRTISCGYSHSTMQDGWTALKSASNNGHHKVVELLLGAGANPDLQDKVGTVVCM